MSSYKTILKTTGLFASLRILSILVNIATSKLIAIFIGVQGIGLYGLYSSALSLITTISDLGISKSSIRNIAVAEGKQNKDEIEKTISVISKLIYITGAVGALITILLSFQISKWSFGDSSYWISFVLLGICVFFTIIKNGQSAIFQGLRKYKLITNSTIYSSLITLLISAPLIYFFKENSIIYVILIGSIISFFVTTIYLRKVEYKSSKLKIKLTKENSFEIIRLGLSLMLVSFLVSLSAYIIRAYISNYGSVKDLGYFQAGFQIISGYFGIIFTSMSTDFFPRISAIQDDNNKLAQEVNQQTVITLLLICPLVVILPFVMPFVIKTLYSENFTSTVEYVNIALFGIIFQAGSQILGMILLAKNNAKVYLIYVFSLQIICLIFNILGYKYFGVLGLGASFVINMLLQLISSMIINNIMYSIKFDSQILKVFVIVLFFAMVSYFFKNLEGIFFYIAFILNLSLSLIYVFIKFKNILNIVSIYSTIKSKIFKN